MKIPVTVVIPVRNEESNLATCLASVAEYAEEIVVIDSHSTDETPAVAAAHGVALRQFDWDGGPEKKRNWALRTYPFRTEWVLFLDADERMTKEVWSEIERTIHGPVDGLQFWFVNHFAGAALRWGDRQRKVAMTRVGRGRYEYVTESALSTLDMEVHEHLLIEGPVAKIGAPILHNDYRGVDHWYRKHLEYAAWEAERVRATRSDRRWRQRLKYRVLTRLWFPFAYFVYAYVLRLGFLDGRAGLLFWLAKFSYFLQISIRAQIVSRLRAT
jgi:glycosyltransferase involved in cell wall biosynthesis